MKNKEKYDLNELKYVIIYAPYWNLYTIEVRNRNNESLLDVIKTRKPELDAIMEWLESEEKHD